MTETRRGVLKNIATAAALAALPRGAARRGFASPAAVVEDQAAVQTELTLAIYDDFDGTGGWQAFDGSMLAEAGAFSKELWSFYAAASEVVSLRDIPPPPLVTVDEQGVARHSVVGVRPTRPRGRGGRSSGSGRSARARGGRPALARRR